MEPRAATNRLFCFGLGYTGIALGRALLAQGWSVVGTCRSEEHRDAARAAGMEAVVFERTRPLRQAARIFGAATHVLSTIPPDEFGDPVLDAHVGDLAAAARSLTWAGYLSTTGVYGDRGGDWVDESAELKPVNERGHRRVRAESAWFQLRIGAQLPLHVFRVAGIYGPGRNALEQVRTGAAHRIDKPGQVFSRIHIDDLVAALCASMARPAPGTTYNVCDNDPAAPADVTAFAAQLLGVPAPPLVAIERANLSELARSFYDENKRVRNDRMTRDLGVTLKYPSYREGLTALAKALPRPAATDPELSASGRSRRDFFRGKGRK